MLLDSFQKLDGIVLDGVFVVFASFNLLLHRLGTLAPEEGMSLAGVVDAGLLSFHPRVVLRLELDLKLSVLCCFGSIIGVSAGLHSWLEWIRIKGTEIFQRLANILSKLAGALDMIDEKLRGGLKIRGLLG